MANEIQAAGAATQLTSTTKAQLEAFGITDTEDLTEAQAQTKIENAKKQKVAAGAIAAPPDETEVTSDIKSLADVFHIVYAEDATTDEILEYIAEELEAQIDEAASNPSELSNLLGYYRQLSLLDAQNDEIKAGQSKIFEAMDLFAENNKKALNLE